MYIMCTDVIIAVCVFIELKLAFNSTQLLILVTARPPLIRTVY